MKTSSWPILDRETLTETGNSVDGNYPEDFNGGRWVTGAIVDGTLKLGSAYCDFAVALLDDESMEDFN